ncbi:hypothetical protein CLV24_11314 [Pontibacter ummariensis]|uniref:Cof subfamily of IIB subfamily of haloacid dehalogenase superfamily/HAD-superfamily hydrolase, subfamily IIB n=1 Tax=Pontibacter ummariensis TaxID=1610492 RepID=A0A239HGD7_9BACT|nr:HAD family hydrolase [Pontibacter ummariensis]PRY10595.1 hypothetical protein CLV24_11314 [Pontibacter ummariensis]SNS80400.1 hypothetical protein SAMN06296052_113141 [Pontibacter ummariensis]
MKIRAICTDIDGTLLDSRRQLSPRTIATIKSLPDELPVVLASSRMPSAMRHLQEELDILHHPMICFNGGYILSYEDSTAAPTVLDSVHIPVSTCTAILALAQGTDIHISLYSEDYWYAPKADQWAEREERITKASPQITSLQPVLDRWQETEAGAHKVMCMGPEEEIAAMAAALTERFGDQLFVYKSKSTYLELAPKTISKATALKLLLENRYGINLSEVMAFGDNYNDIDMLKAVGLGIAVGNAREEVKAVADEVTLKSIEDGVAVAIEKYLG